MLTRKEIEAYCRMDAGYAPAIDALAKHDALMEIYHLLGGEGEPEDVVEACKKEAQELIAQRDNLIDRLAGNE